MIVDLHRLICCCHIARIHDFHIDHLAPPIFCMTIVFNFSWNDCNTQEKLETMVIGNLGAEEGARCIIVYVKMVNGL